MITPLAVLVGVNLIGVGSPGEPVVEVGDGDAVGWVGFGDGVVGVGVGAGGVGVGVGVGVGEGVPAPVTVHVVPATAQAVGAIEAPAVLDASSPISTLAPLAKLVAQDGAPNR